MKRLTDAAGGGWSNSHGSTALCQEGLGREGVVRSDLELPAMKTGSQGS